jgi:hypothetical protein
VWTTKVKHDTAAGTMPSLAYFYIIYDSHKLWQYSCIVECAKNTHSDMCSHFNNKERQYLLLLVLLLSINLFTY